LLFQEDAMNVEHRLVSLVLAAALLGIVSTDVGADPAGSQAIGTFTAVYGQVALTRPAEQSVLAKVADELTLKSMIETQRDSRAKASLGDDSFLTVGEHSLVEVGEPGTDLKHGKRSMVVKLLEGKARALVPKQPRGAELRFEIHTPTATATARGGYFVVWHSTSASDMAVLLYPPGNASAGSKPSPHRSSTATEGSVEGMSGLANIGDSGNVEFTSGGQTVVVKPGHFSVAAAEQPPLLPMPMAKGIPGPVSQVIRATSVVNGPRRDPPKDLVRAAFGTFSKPAPPPQNAGGENKPPKPSPWDWLGFRSTSSTRDTVPPPSFETTSP
jgi:hypothetical protein